MDIRSELVLKVLTYLNANANYAVLRNFEGLPCSNESTDIDIIITEQGLRQHQLSIIQLIANCGWKILIYRNNGRLKTFVCSTIYKNNVQIVQWDFFLNTSVHGLILIDAKKLLKEREFNGILYHVSKSNEFLDKYVYNRAVGAPYPEKYQSIREEVGRGKQVKIELQKVYGIDDIEIIDRLSNKNLVARALRKNLKTKFFKTIGQLAKSQWLYFYNFLSSRTAVRIGFTGPDGAGKTTVIELLRDQISSVFGKATEYYHFRPDLLPNLGDAAHTGGLKKEVDKKYDQPHRGKEKGTVNSLLRLCYYTIDFIVGFWVKVKPHCRLTKFVIFDRYFTDIIADSRRSSIHLNPKILFLWSKLFIPSLQYNILLTADTEVILSRKQELDADGINRINKNLDFLSGKKGYYLVLNNTKPKDAAEKILALVFQEQHLKNMKRIGKE